MPETRKLSEINGCQQADEIGILSLLTSAVTGNIHRNHVRSDIILSLYVQSRYTTRYIAAN
jgi:hypothetical protein